MEIIYRIKLISLNSDLELRSFASFRLHAYRASSSKRRRSIDDDTVLVWLAIADCFSSFGVHTDCHTNPLLAFPVVFRSRAAVFTLGSLIENGF